MCLSSNDEDIGITCLSDTQLSTIQVNDESYSDNPPCIYANYFLYASVLIGRQSRGADAFYQKEEEFGKKRSLIEQGGSMLFLPALLLFCEAVSVCVCERVSVCVSASESGRIRVRKHALVLKKHALVCATFKL